MIVSRILSFDFHFLLSSESCTLTIYVKVSVRKTLGSNLGASHKQTTHWGRHKQHQLQKIQYQKHVILESIFINLKKMLLGGDSLHPYIYLEIEN